MFVNKRLVLVGYTGCQPHVSVVGWPGLIGKQGGRVGRWDAVVGVACWDKWDPKSDRFSIYVRGLSDGYVEAPPASGGKPTARYKTLRIDFVRRGDEHNLNEREIQLADPPYQWVYW